MPDERYTETSEATYSTTIEKDLSYKLSVLHQTKEEYLSGQLPQWFGPHKDRITLL